VGITLSPNNAILDISLQSSILKKYSISPILVDIQLKSTMPIVIKPFPFSTNILLSASLTPYFYVVDSNNHRVQAFFYNGDFAFNFGSYGSGEGQFKYPYDITNDEDFLYVTDTGNNRVEVFDLYGNFKSFLSSNELVLDKPLGITVDNDFVYIISYNNKTLYVCLKNGRVVTTRDLSVLQEEPTNASVDDYFLYLESENFVYKFSKAGLYTKIISSVLPTISSTSTVKSTLNKISTKLSTISLESVATESVVANQIHFILPKLSFTLLSLGYNFNLSRVSINAMLLNGASLSSNFILPNLYLDFNQRVELNNTIKVSIPKLILNKDLTTVTIVLKKLKLNSKVLNGKVIESKFILPKLYSDLNQIEVLDNIIKASIPKLSLLSTIIYKHNCIIKSGLSSLYINSILYTSDIHIHLSIPKIKGNIFILGSIQSKSRLLLPTLQSIFILNSQEFIEEFIEGHHSKIVVLHTYQNAVTEYYGSEYRFKLATLDSFYPVKMKPVEIYLYGSNIPEGNINYIISDSTTLQIPILDYNNNMKETRVKLPKGVKNRMINLEFNFSNPFTINSIHLLGYSINKRRR